MGVWGTSVLAVCPQAGGLWHSRRMQLRDEEVTVLEPDISHGQGGQFGKRNGASVREDPDGIGPHPLGAPRIPKDPPCCPGRGFAAFPPLPASRRRSGCPDSSEPAPSGQGSSVRSEEEEEAGKGWCGGWEGRRVPGRRRKDRRARDKAAARHRDGKRDFIGPGSGARSPERGAAESGAVRGRGRASACPALLSSGRSPGREEGPG